MLLISQEILSKDTLQFNKKISYIEILKLPIFFLLKLVLKLLILDSVSFKGKKNHKLPTMLGPQLI